jgi:hypothetical protein
MDIDVLDGKLINPDSGVKDDPIPGPNNDYQDTFQAEGLDKSIPWFQTLGNHDHFWKGSYPLTNNFRPNYTPRTKGRGNSYGRHTSLGEISRSAQKLLVRLCLINFFFIQNYDKFFNS